MAQITISPVQACLELFKSKTNELFTPLIDLRDIEKISKNIEECEHLLKDAVSKLSEEEQKQLQSSIQKEVVMQLINSPDNHMKITFFAALAMKLMP